MTALEKKHEAGQIVHEARAMLEKADAEKRAMTADENAQYDAMMDKAEAIVEAAERMERAERLQFSPNGQGGSPASVRPEINPGASGGEESRGFGAMGYDAAFRAFMQYGRDGITQQQRAVLQIDVDVNGGFVGTSKQLISGIIQSLKDKIVVMENATVYTAPYGKTLGQLGITNGMSDIGFEGEIGSAEDVDSITFSERKLTPKLMKTFKVPISIYLLRNESIDVEGAVGEAAFDVIGRSLEKRFMTGTGTLGPLGLFTASSEGISTARDSSTDNAATALTADGLIEAQGKLDPVYDGSAKWLFHRDAITKIRKLKTTTSGDYIWQLGLTAGTQNVILGHPYITGTYVPNTWTSGKYVGMYGDLSQYIIAAGEGMEIQRLVESGYAEKNQIALLFRNAAFDGMPRREDAFVRIKLG